MHVVQEVYYPKLSPTRQFYDQCRTTNGGYGGLFSITFWSSPDAKTFYDALTTAKGPSLGTNFTLWLVYLLLDLEVRAYKLQLSICFVGPLRRA